jgi:hypothetical protein
MQLEKFPAFRHRDIHFVVMLYYVGYCGVLEKTDAIDDV